MVCCTDGSADLARLLLQNGADTKIKNSAGENFHIDKDKKYEPFFVTKKTVFISVLLEVIPLSFYGLNQ